MPPFVVAAFRPRGAPRALKRATTNPARIRDSFPNVHQRATTNRCAPAGCTAENAENAEVAKGGEQARSTEKAGWHGQGEPTPGPHAPGPRTLALPVQARRQQRRSSAQPGPSHSRGVEPTIRRCGSTIGIAVEHSTQTGWFRWDRPGPRDTTTGSDDGSADSRLRLRRASECRRTPARAGRPNPGQGEAT